jgi:predicted branched-subunit amino acid permease
MSVSITVGAYGVAFGAAAVANGFTVVQACLLSLLTFSGASQFAVIGVIGAVDRRLVRLQRRHCWEFETLCME